MLSTLFSDSFPTVSSEEELIQIQRKYPNYDPYYVTSGSIWKRNILFESLWNSFKPYADSNFLSDIKTHFHQRSWEMYICKILLDKQFQLRSSDEGPDFIVDEKYYVECVAPTKGKVGNKDSVPAMKIGEGDVPIDKMILRIANAFDEKSQKYQKWKKNIINSHIPYVIAINTADLGYSEDPNMPNVIKTLFGFQFLQVNLRTRAATYTFRTKISKSNGSEIGVIPFASNRFSHVSGVLFSDSSVLNSTSEGSDLFFINNPYAKNIVAETFVKHFKSWNAVIKEDSLRLIRRFSFGKDS